MTKKEYLAKRKALLDAAEALLNEGKMDDYEAKCKEVEALDAQFEAIAKAQANMNALKDKAVVKDVQDMQDGGDNADAIDTTGTAKPKDEKEVYRNAWAKVMMGQRLGTDEREVFDKVNTEFKKEFKNLVQTTNDHAVVIPETVATDIWTEAENASRSSPIPT